jgi:hypothetical protein
MNRFRLTTLTGIVIYPHLYVRFVLWSGVAQMIEWIFESSGAPLKHTAIGGVRELMVFLSPPRAVGTTKAESLCHISGISEEHLLHEMPQSG